MMLGRPIYPCFLISLVSVPKPKSCPAVRLVFPGFQNSVTVVQVYSEVALHVGVLRRHKMRQQLKESAIPLAHGWQQPRGDLTA